MTQLTSPTLKTLLLSACAGAALFAAGCEQNTRTTTADDSYSDLVKDETATTAEKPSITQSTENAAADMIRGSGGATVQDAKAFLEDAETRLEEAFAFSARAAWVKANFITEDTNWLETKASTEVALLITELANGAKRFNDIKLPKDMARKMDALKRGSNFPAPNKPGAAANLAQIMTQMDSAYGSGQFAFDTKNPKVVAIIGQDNDGMINLGQATKLMAELRDPDLLEQVWTGWRTIVGPKTDGAGNPSYVGMKKQYSDMVGIINEGSRELGYADAGALWRGGYDMPADEFAKEADRLWGQVKPLYDELHCHVRFELNEYYGDEVVPLDQPIRADLLGNMWAQQWGNVYDITKPNIQSKTVDMTALLEKADYDAEKMVRTGDAFFTSMGFEPMPETFYQRSLFTKPADRDVQCHASAWNIDDQEDVRIKMCITITGEDFVTIHHEIGHNIYQRAYKDQPVFYRTGANDGFHEAIGDMIALSITPDYLVDIGLLKANQVPDESGDIPLLYRQALDKVAFMPWGLMVDKWRWQVFNGELTPAEYNDGWWALREEYQGVRPPNDRPADAFDPGAKYHIPGNTPYMRYFLAHILQFQFHKAACEQAGNEGALHRCSVYGNEEVGARFNAMMEMGASKPWPDALEAFTGTRNMDGSAMLEYFAPLQSWLEEQNEGRDCGWE